MLFTTITTAQQVLSLNKVVQDAQHKSPSYYRAQSNALNSLYAYRYFVSGQLPELRMDFNNSSSPMGETISVLQQDGTYQFARRSYSTSSLGLSLRQIVPLTGGIFSVRSSLARNDQFSPYDTSSYLSTPFSISYNQPMILYNGYKWERRIQPLLYEESRRQYVENMEKVSLDASGLYFNALSAQVQERILQSNVSNTDTLYKISQGRYGLGKIAENELLQIELSLLNARTSLEQATLNKEIAYQNLKQFLSMPKDAEILLNAPDSTPVFVVRLDKAIAEANTNRQAVLAFRRRRLQSEQEVAQAKGNSGYEFNLNANLGKSRDGATIGGVYTGGMAQQSFSVGVGIPIVDWGKARNRIRQAKANRSLAEIDIEQDERSFEQEIYLQTQLFNIQQRQLTSAAKADTIARQRYEITKQRYLIGKISITDLNLAQQEKDQASQSYINSLRSYWNAYYTVRRLTLYDFEKEQKIQYEFEE
jgi:outer membrane protein TolC